MPWLWVIAGPSGSGKSTLVDSGAIDEVFCTDLIHLNADVRTREILAAEPDAADANLRAAIETDARLAACIERRQDVLVETVLSSTKYFDDLQRALSLGYDIGIIFVCLESPDVSIERVAVRRERGGHDVPPNRVRQRWHRSISHLGQIVGMASRVYVFDNTPEAGPVLIAQKTDGPLVILAPGRIPEIDAVLTP